MNSNLGGDVIFLDWCAKAQYRHHPRFPKSPLPHPPTPDRPQHATGSASELLTEVTSIHGHGPSTSIKNL
jgi:hypothetical protein